MTPAQSTYGLAKNVRTPPLIMQTGAGAFPPPEQQLSDFLEKIKV
jgi:hypothetical protein